MKLGVIADDFTGASDIALTLAEGGMKVAQFTGVPSIDADTELDAGVISLKSRTAPVSEAVEQSLAACDWLMKQGCSQIINKVCSTFDSTDEGNIGPITQALADKLGEEKIIVCPAFPENGRSVYQGHLFVNDSLLNESGMQNHPLTPMRDADLRRVLAPQTSRAITHLAAPTVFSGVEATKEAIEAMEPSMVIADAIRDEDLRILGKAAKARKLLCGGSGIAIGLPANWGIEPSPVKWSGVAGRAVIISGSCSIATRGQVANYKSLAPNKEITADAVMAEEHSPASLADWVMAQPEDGLAPIIYSSADPAIVKQAQQRYGGELLAEKIETLFADLASELVKRGVSRLVTAGGETSGAVVRALDVKSMTIGPKIAAGVPALNVDGRNVALALKSGNFGDEHFFEKALAILAG